MGLSLLIIGTVVLAALAVYMLFYQQREEFREKIDERLEGLLRSKAVESDETLNILRQDVFGQLSPFNRFVLRFKLGNEMFRLLEQADVNIRPHQLVLLCLGLTVMVAGLSWYLRGSILVSAAVGLASGAVPIFYVAWARKKRLAQFLEQLPDALDLITRALRAGHAFTSSLQTVASEMPDPVSKEFRRTFEENNLGMSLKASLEHLTERVPLLELKLCVTAILIQRETGGNLAEILENIADVIRERFKILGQVKVYTAQGRMTGWVIGSIPFVLALYIHAVNPDYLKLLFTHRLGQGMLAVGLTMQLIGALVIRKIIRIRI